MATIGLDMDALYPYPWRFENVNKSKTVGYRNGEKFYIYMDETGVLRPDFKTVENLEETIRSMEHRCRLTVAVKDIMIEMGIIDGTIENGLMNGYIISENEAYGGEDDETVVKAYAYTNEYDRNTLRKWCESHDVFGDSDEFEALYDRVIRMKFED